MATNKVVLREVSEVMNDYTPIYQPLYPFLLKGKAQSYAQEVGVNDFKRIQAVGDIRSKMITPKDTEMAQLSVNQGTKSFKKYFSAIQYIQSALQNNEQTEDVIKQVLDEANKQYDERVLFGEGTVALTDVVNNGLFWSNDPNYLIEGSPASVSDSDLKTLHDAVLVSANKAEALSGPKTIIFYGADIIPLFDSVYDTYPTPFKQVLQGVLPGYTLTKAPVGLDFQNESGWLVVSNAHVKFHYTTLPSLNAQGLNDEKMYSWHNFVMGSALVDVLTQNGIIHQAATVS